MANYKCKICGKWLSDYNESKVFCFSDKRKRMFEALSNIKLTREIPDEEDDVRPGGRDKPAY